MTPAQHYFTSALVTAIAAFVFAVFVFKNSPNRKLAYHFIWYSYCISHWSFFVFACTSVSSHDLSYRLAQVCHLVGVFIPVAFLHFVIVLIRSASKWLKRVIFVAYLIIGFIALAILIKPELFITDVTPKLTFNFFPNPGPLFYLWTILFVILVAIALVVLFFEAQKKTGAEKKRLLFFLIANSLGYLGGVGCFLPVYNMGFFPFPYGIWGVFFFVGVTFYAVLRYQFIDVEIIIKKTLIFAGVFSFLFGIFAFVLFFLADVLQQRVGGVLRWWLLATTCVIVALTTRNFELFLVQITDRFLFQKKFDYRKILKSASEGLSYVNSLRYQLRLVTHFITSRARIRAAAIYMAENGAHDFILKESRCIGSTMVFQPRIHFDSQVLIYLKKERTKPYLEHYEMEDQARKYAKNGAMYKYDLVELREEMRELNAHLIIPSFYQNELQGVLVLSEKKSEEPYSEEDINLFQTIAQESAIAFENARKHDEIIEKNQKLEEMNEALRKSQEEVIQVKQESAVAQLSGGISHEVKNAILALAEAIEQINATVESVSDDLGTWYESGEPVPEYQKEDLFRNLKNARYFLNQAKQTSRHIEGVVQTLSQMSKGKHAQMTMMSVKSFLLQMISIGMLRTYGDRVRTQALEEPPKLEVASDLPLIHANAHLLRAVFMNFFKNSIYAMDHISPKRITIRAMMDPEMKDMVRIEFEDNGKGIPPEILLKIFDYGFTTKGEEGEGKGLYNVKSMIEGEHHGAISVKSEVGKGTTFILKLPTYRFDDEKE